MNLFTKLGRPDPTFYAGGSGVFGPEIALASFALLCGDEPGEQGRDFSHLKEDYRRRGVGAQALKELFKHKSLQVFVVHFRYLLRSPGLITIFVNRLNITKRPNSVCVAFCERFPDGPQENPSGGESIYWHYKVLRQSMYIVYLILSFY
jgi:hypothetical protein